MQLLCCAACLEALDDHALIADSPRKLNAKCIPERCESEGGSSTKIYAFLAQAGWREQSKPPCLFRYSAIGTHKTPESRWKRLGLAGNAILAAVQHTLDRLKARKIQHLRESRGTSSNRSGR
jgi:hypothetical protein